MRNPDQVEETSAEMGSPPKRFGQMVAAEVLLLCNGVIESAWLAAVILVPTLFNPHSQTGFQSDKITFFRLLTFIIAAAWTTKSFGDERPFKARVDEAIRFCWHCPLVLALGALALCYGLATAFSLDPYASLWGSYDHMEGTVTFACGIVFLAALAVHLRSDAQVERLTTTITIGSFPLVLYGLMERAGYDAIPQPQLTHTRIFSLLGHPMYFAAYLLLVIPLCLFRVLKLCREIKSGAGLVGLRLTGVALYGFILATQVLAFLFTETRGSVLGLIAGLTFFALSAGISSRRRSILVLGFGAMMVVLLGLGLLALPNGPFQRWTTLPIVHRLSQTFSQKEAAASIRLDYWAAAVRIMTSHEPISIAKGESDHRHWLRPLIGYGPETVEGVLDSEYTYPGTDFSVRTDRLHNLILDNWLTLGTAGVAGLTTCLVLAFFEVYRRLRWISSLKSVLLFLGLSLGLTFLTATVLVFWRGPGLVGVGIQCGLAASLTIYPVVAFLLGMYGKKETDSPESLELLLLALLAALLGHLVDTAFGFETPATSVLVWVYLGTIIALSRQHWSALSDYGFAGTAVTDVLLAQGAASRRTGGQTGIRGRGGSPRPALYAAAITALILVSLLFAFISLYSIQPYTILAVLGQSLTRFDHGQRINPYLVPLLLLTWMGCSLALTLDEARRNAKARWWSNFLLTLAVSGLIAGGYATLKSAQIVAIGPLPGAQHSDAGVMGQCLGYVWLCVEFLGLCVVFVLCAGWLSSRETPLSRHCSGPILLAGLGSVFAVTILIWFTTIGFLREDVTCRWGQVLRLAGDESSAAEMFRRSITLNPRRLDYRIYYADLMTSWAEKASNKSDFRERMAEAEQVLMAAPGGGLNRRARRLAELYLEWTAKENDSSARLSLAKKASVAFDQALVVEPKSELVWRESAAVDILFLSKDEAGAAKIRRAGQLGRKQNQLDFAQYYADKCQNMKSVLLKRQYENYALEYYGNALRDASARGASTFNIHLAMATLPLKLEDAAQAIAAYAEAAVRLQTNDPEAHFKFGVALDAEGRPEEAIPQFLEALNLKPDGVDIHHILGITLGRMGRNDEAILQLQEALRLKPDDAGTHNDLGNAFDSLGRTDEAIGQYQDAIRQEPDDPDAHANLGAAYGKKGNLAGAIFQLQEAIRLQPDNVLGHFNLGQALEQQGQTGEAIQQYQDALRLSPNFAAAQRSLAQALNEENSPGGR